MFSEYTQKFITDVQYFEGFVGAFGTIFAFVFFRRILKLKNMSIVVGLSFLTSWIVSKVSMNIYKELKNDTEKKYDIGTMKGVNAFILFVILLSSALAYKVAIKKISYLSMLVYAFFISFFYFFVKQ